MTDLPKHEYKMSEEALKLNRDATPEEKELFLRLQRIIFAGTGFFEEEKNMSGETKQRINDLEAEIARLKEAQPTLRDQFAMAALTGILACPVMDGDIPTFCKLSYAYADEMMEARDAK